ncbi:hypothetical protein BO94DRAFT_572749 [Aspergillus sclerotioniger CBS 115572]|uniref:Transferase family protein n=1 Tax=Aspergillus sclerotioniger CBS 115572 TaxID=1450535 RepID=A0A317X9H2_9EURO|nr:hypothetical protein BO94DRAFT_572749 [Aspergillus sclerotioniger CBS 115572]PWY94267.1 hypothetical protein BO94DRAFT_572749 [Aspergillus sclerotioniger CBS 115572]
MNASHSFHPFVPTPLDHSMPRLYVPQFLCFHTTTAESAVQHLHVGVHRLFKNLPFLAGEVVTNEDTGGVRVQSPSVSTRNIPYLAIQTRPDDYLPARQDAQSNPLDRDRKRTNLDASYSPLPVVLPPSQPQPIIRFQANILADGVLFAVTYHHAIMDGTGCGELLEMLAQCCSALSDEDVSLPTDSHTQEVFRQYISNLSPTTTTTTTTTNNNYKELYHPVMKSTDHIQHPPFALRTEQFTFPAKQITTLRDACNRLLPELTTTTTTTTTPLPQQTLSSNDILTALISLAITRTTTPIKPNTLTLTMSVNLRSRIHPTSLTHYLGTAITAVRVNIPINPTQPTLTLPTTTITTIPDLTSLTQTAHQIRTALNTLTRESIPNLITHIRERRHAGEDICLQMGDIVVSSWRHLSVYGIDFGPGLGKITGFEVQEGLMERLVVVLPRKRDGDGDGDWDVCITLSEHEMEGFRRDGLVRWVLGE